MEKLDAGGVDDEQFRTAVLAHLLEAREDGFVSRAAVREAAAACGVSERTLWRWLQRGRAPQRASWAWTPTTRTTELLERWRGNVAAVHRQLVREGERVPSRRTVARALERELRPVEREHPRRGIAAVRDRSVYLRHAAWHRAECYEADHKELSIEVLPPRSVRPRRPWVTLFVDQFSRLIVGWAISLRPTQAEVLAALRMAVTVDAGHGPFGGVPTVLRWDRGPEFAARSIEQATRALGCVSRRTDAYSPWQKGKVERLNRTIEQTLLQGLPGWTGGPRDERGRLVSETPLTLERFVGLFADWVADHNTRRPHDGLGGRTPMEAYEQAAPELLALIDDRYAHGCFREWASFTHSALALCHERHAPELTEEIARGARAARRRQPRRGRVRPRPRRCASCCTRRSRGLRADPRGEKLVRAVEWTYLRPAPTQEAAAELLGLPFSTYRGHRAASRGSSTGSGGASSTAPAREPQHWPTAAERKLGRSSSGISAAGRLMLRGDLQFRIRRGPAGPSH